MRPEPEIQTKPQAIPTIEATPKKESQIYISDVITANCIRVIDRDTLEVEYNGKRNKIRLIGVDTPETKDPRKPVQYFGKEATNFTRKAAGGKSIRLEFDQTLRDKYSRLLAHVYLPSGEMLNAKIIKEGYGHAYTKYPFKYLEEFRIYEIRAREKGLGLWGKREVKEESQKARTPNETSYKEETSSEIPPSQEQGETVYITPTGKKYHREYCSYLRRYGSVRAWGVKFPRATRLCTIGLKGWFYKKIGVRVKLVQPNMGEMHLPNLNKTVIKKTLDPNAGAIYNILCVSSPAKNSENFGKCTQIVNNHYNLGMQMLNRQSGKSQPRLKTSIVMPALWLTIELSSISKVTNTAWW